MSPTINSSASPDLDSRSHLDREFERRVRANPRYSLRAFARDLGVSPGNLSELLAGKRKITFKTVARFATKLGLSATETRNWLGAAAVEAAGIPVRNDASEIRERELSLDHFHIISDWYCFAILNLTETRDFKFDARWIARRLGISPSEAKLGLERLNRVGLIRRVLGRYELDREFVLSPTGIPSNAVRAYHTQILAKAAIALETQSVAERDITGVGMAIDPRRLPEIREEIRKFQDHLVSAYSRGRKTEVYQLEIALFRITENGEKGS